MIENTFEELVQRLNKAKENLQDTLSQENSKIKQNLINKYTREIEHLQYKANDFGKGFIVRCFVVNHVMGTDPGTDIYTTIKLIHEAYFVGISSEDAKRVFKALYKQVELKDINAQIIKTRDITTTQSFQ